MRSVGLYPFQLITHWGEGQKFPRSSDPAGGRPRQPFALRSGAMRPRLPLPAGVAVARAAGRLSRLAGAGGGTTIPGKLLNALDPGAVGRLASQLPQGSAIVSATNGKTTTAAMVAEILAPQRLAHNSAGANLLSGVASTLLSANGADLGLFEVDEAALPDVARRVRPRALCLGNLFRDQLDRYGELELVAERWRGLVGELDPDVWVVANADDPQVGDLARDRRVSTSGWTTSDTGRQDCSTQRTPSGACAAERHTSTRRPTSGTSGTTAVRPAAMHGRRSTSPPGRSSSTGWNRSRSTWRTSKARCAFVCRSRASTTSTTPSRQRRLPVSWAPPARKSVPGSSVSARRSDASSGFRSGSAVCSCS